MQIFPVFVVSLALTAFANGLWMSVDGFMVTPKILNVFWRYVFHYIDYQVGPSSRIANFKNINGDIRPTFSRE
jgi:hypothetical protein